MQTTNITASRVTSDDTAIVGFAYAESAELAKEYTDTEDVSACKS